jgi:hypothetical protein
MPPVAAIPLEATGAGAAAGAAATGAACWTGAGAGGGGGFGIACSAPTTVDGRGARAPMMWGLAYLIC